MHRLIPYTTAALALATGDVILFTGFSKKTLSVAVPWVETSTGPGGFMICGLIL